MQPEPLGCQRRTRGADSGGQLYIPAGCWHAYRNEGEVPVRFLCMVPVTARYETKFREI